MKPKETVVLNSYEISEININSDSQIVSFNLFDDCTIQIKLNEKKRIEVLCTNENYPLLVKPLAKTALEIMPELPENSYEAGDQEDFIAVAKSIEETSFNDVEFQEDFGITVSKMTMKKKK